MNKKIVLSILTGLLLVTSVVAVSRYYGFEAIDVLSDESYLNLCYKEAPDWNCGYRNGKYVSGTLKYENAESGMFKGFLYTYGLEPNAEYQVKLNSYGAGFEADTFATACDNPETGAIWQCGKWGDEGFVVIDTITTDSIGRIRQQVSVDLPKGVYESKVLICQNGGDWGCHLMETKAAEFVVLP